MRGMIAIALVPAMVGVMLSGPCRAVPISGFMCLSRVAAESMIAANARGSQIDNYSEEDALGMELIASGLCFVVSHAAPIDTVEVYRGPHVALKGGVTKQVVGFARTAKEPPSLWGFDFAKGYGI